MDPAHAHPARTTSSLLEEGSMAAEATERYASMFTHHPHAAFSVDQRGYYTDANRRALEMTGLSLQQMRQTNFSQVIHPDDVLLMQDGFERVLEGEPQVIDARVVRVDGEVVDIRCTAIPVVVGGRVVGVHGITEDVTEAKRLVRELEEANAAKLLFLGTVSHEVRTPLAALVGAVDLLMHSELTPETRHYAQVVQRSSERLARLAGDLLEFSGLEAHRTVLRRAPFEVRAVVRDVADWAVPLGESGGLDVSFTVEESVPATGNGDARRIGQVLANLVRNAISFTAHGSVAVRVSASEGPTGSHDSTAAGTWIEMEVTDTGIGIEPEQLGFLFEPFRLVDPCPARAHQGVGLGLAISRDLVDLMGGRLHARSTPREGSTFTFTFPLGTADPA